MDLQNLKESIFVGALLTGVFLPIRMLFFEYVSDAWLGSFGLVSITLFVIVFLSRKNKLGKVGQIIHKQIKHKSQGKLGKISICTGLFMIYFFALGVAGTQFYDPELKAITDQGLEENGITNVETLLSKPIEFSTWESYFVPFLIFIPNPITFLASETLNEMTDGWYLHFMTVFLVESAEVFAIVMYFRYEDKLTKQKLSKPVKPLDVNT